MIFWRGRAASINPQYPLRTILSKVSSFKHLCPKFLIIIQSLHISHSELPTKGSLHLCHIDLLLYHWNKIYSNLFKRITEDLVSDSQYKLLYLDHNLLFWLLKTRSKWFNKQGMINKRAVGTRWALRKHLLTIAMLGQAVLMNDLLSDQEEWSNMKTLCLDWCS